MFWNDINHFNVLHFQWKQFHCGSSITLFGNIFMNRGILDNVIFAICFPFLMCFLTNSSSWQSVLAKPGRQSQTPVWLLQDPPFSQELQRDWHFNPQKLSGQSVERGKGIYWSESTCYKGMLFKYERFYIVMCIVLGFALLLNSPICAQILKIVSIRTTINMRSDPALSPLAFAKKNKQTSHWWQ